MDRISKATRKIAAAGIAAAAFLTSAFVFAEGNQDGPKTETKTTQPKGTSTTIVIEAKTAVAAPVPAAAPVQAVVRLRQAVDVEGMTAQYIPRLRPILVAEMRLLTSAAGPSPAQRREIALEAGKALKLAAKKAAEVQFRMNQGQAEVFPDPKQMIRESLEAAAKAKLPAEGFERYKKELEARVKDQRAVVALNLVVNLDKLLMLSADQREKLSASLLAHWDDRIFPSIENVVQYEAYFPNIPDQAILPILNGSQTIAWRGTNKIRFDSIRNYNLNSLNTVANAGADEDEDVTAALAEGVKP